MTIFLLATHAAAFVAGGAVVWVYKTKIQADVTVVNQTVAAAKTTAATVVSDIKKV